jgi:hypothetical protein
MIISNLDWEVMVMSITTLMEKVKEQTMEINSFQEVDMQGLKCPIIAIYRNPDDYPQAAVARLFNLEEPMNVILVRNTVAELREDIMKSCPWMVRFDRAKNDVLSISETWI